MRALRLRLDVEAHPDQPADHNGGAPNVPVSNTTTRRRADQFGYYISQSVPQSAANSVMDPMTVTVRGLSRRYSRHAAARVKKTTDAMTCNMCIGDSLAQPSGPTYLFSCMVDGRILLRPDGVVDQQPQ
jgi:2-C-methyl-D-erythritol 4-phosphate cytidylyltransferase